MCETRNPLISRVKYTLLCTSKCPKKCIINQEKINKEMIHREPGGLSPLTYRYITSKYNNYELTHAIYFLVKILTMLMKPADR